jgi:tetratricopeptide (TPR) repeat protein
MAFFLSYKSEAQTSTVKEELAKAQSLAKQGNKEEASKIYTGIMANYPDNREAVLGWMDINIKMPPGEEVIKQFEELGKSYPNNTAVLAYKSLVLIYAKHYDEALADLDKLITLQPDSAGNWIGKAETLSLMNRNEEALKAFEKTISLDPKRDDAWAEKADVLSKLGRYAEVILTYNKAVELSTNHNYDDAVYGHLFYNRGRAYCRKGDKANALGDLKKAISLNPGLKEDARKDEDFKSLWDEEDFKNLITQ